MTAKTILDLTLKASPAATDVTEIQESGGASRRTTLAGLSTLANTRLYTEAAERTPAPGDEALFWRDGVAGRGTIEDAAPAIARGATRIDPREWASLVSEGNWTPAFNAAHDAAVAEKGAVFVPAGEWGLADSVIVKAPMVGVGAFTPGTDPLSTADPRLARFVNIGIDQPDQGMLVVPINATGGFITMEGFQVYGKSETGVFCRGITTLGDIASPHGPVPRFRLKDLIVYRCYNAIDWEGWIGVIDNVHTRRSCFGLTIRNPNGVVVLGGEFSAASMPGVTAGLWEVRVIEG
jgi:hypothetical protein